MNVVDNFDKLRLAAYEAAVTAYEAAVAAHFAPFDNAFTLAFTAAQAAKTASQLAHANAFAAAEVVEAAFCAYDAADIKNWNSL